MEKYFLVNERVKEKMMSDLDALPIGENLKITVTKTGTKSERQRSLNWLWNGDVLESGVGNFETDMDVHRYSKELFAIPILKRDSEIFPYLYEKYLEVTAGNWKKAHIDRDRNEFLDNYVRTEKFSVKQSAEYLKKFQRYWITHSVQLTDPNYYGLGE